jgi:hypothetical protein
MKHRVSSKQWNARECPSTYCKENPLQELAEVVRLRLGIKDELVISIVVLFKVQENRGGFEYSKVIAGSVDQGRYASIRIQVDEPRFLLSVLPKIYRLDTALAMVKATSRGQ